MKSITFHHVTLLPLLLFLLVANVTGQMLSSSLKSRTRLSSEHLEEIGKPPTICRKKSKPLNHFFSPLLFESANNHDDDINGSKISIYHSAKDGLDTDELSSISKAPKTFVKSIHYSIETQNVIDALLHGNSTYAISFRKNYGILGFIGQGGNGMVYKAGDTNKGTLVPLVQSYQLSSLGCNQV